MSTVKPLLTMSTSGFQEATSRLHLARWAPIPLRLIVGYGFLAHGLAKLEKGPAPAFRLYVDQADGCDGGRTQIRATGVRD